MDSDWRVLPEEIIEGRKKYVLEERYEWVDGRRAAELLADSIGNRPIGGVVLDNLIADMNSGSDFKRLEEPVQLDSRGKLMNAHHRCEVEWRMLTLKGAGGQSTHHTS